MAFHHMTADQVILELQSDARQGLQEDEARSRLERVGRNELQTEEGKSAWQKFFGQFKDTLVILLPYYDDGLARDLVRGSRGTGHHPGV